MIVAETNVSDFHNPSLQRPLPNLCNDQEEYFFTAKFAENNILRNKDLVLFVHFLRPLWFF